MSEAKSRIVVIAMDGSDISFNAFEWYIKHIRKSGDKVVFVHCPESSAIHSLPLLMGGDAAAEADMRSVISKDRVRMNELVLKLENKLQDTQVDGKVLCVGGSPGEVVVRMALSENASMIITGTRGLGAIRRTFMGSVSDYIVHHSNVPVLVCRNE